MTEEEWLACDAPDVLLRSLHGRASERKLRLCAAHVARLVVTSQLTTPRAQQYDSWLTDPRWLDWLDAAERFADNLLTRREVLAVRQGGGGPYNLFRSTCAVSTFSIEMVATSLHWARHEFGLPPAQEACAVIRDVVDPFHQRGADPSWRPANDGAALRLARTIYDHREVSLLPLLADALEDAGCADEDLLSHLRGAGPHVRGCWAVDLILGKG